jgi:hypothetical protein
LIIGDAALGAYNTIVSQRLLSASDARDLRWHIDQRFLLGRAQLVRAHAPLRRRPRPSPPDGGGGSWPRALARKIHEALAGADQAVEIV